MFIPPTWLQESSPEPSFRQRWRRAVPQGVDGTWGFDEENMGTQPAKSRISWEEKVIGIGCPRKKTT
jgi:hypothetical protein